MLRRVQKCPSVEAASTETIPARWLTVDQAARYLSVSPQTIRSILHRGEIPAARLSPGAGGYHLDIRDLDRWLERKKKTVLPYRTGTRPHVRRVKPWDFRKDRKPQRASRETQ